MVVLALIVGSLWRGPAMTDSGVNHAGYCKRWRWSNVKLRTRMVNAATDAAHVAARSLSMQQERARRHSTNDVDAREAEGVFRALW
jgi:hypothetical protein